MLLCNCCDNYDEDVIDLDRDWFTGHCNECFKKIRSRSHALRFPIHDGSWRSCFCSFQCLKAYIEDLPDCYSNANVVSFSIIINMYNYLQKNSVIDSLDSLDSLEMTRQNTVRKPDDYCSRAEIPLTEYKCKTDTFDTRLLMNSKFISNIEDNLDDFKEAYIEADLSVLN